MLLFREDEAEQIRDPGQEIVDAGRAERSPAGCQSAGLRRPSYSQTAHDDDDVARPTQPTLARGRVKSEQGVVGIRYLSCKLAGNFLFLAVYTQLRLFGTFPPPFACIPSYSYYVLLLRLPEVETTASNARFLGEFQQGKPNFGLNRYRFAAQQGGPPPPSLFFPFGLLCDTKQSQLLTDI